MAFRNFGLDWRWYRSINQKGHRGMWGRNNSTGKVADFYNQRGIYILKRDEEVVYVGKATSEYGIGWRLYDHSISEAHRGRWNTFCWFGILKVNLNGSLHRASKINMEAVALIGDFEAVLIYLMNARLNKTSGKYKHMESYVQEPPD